MGSQAHYAREIERMWSGFLERPAILSPGDWRWITDWHGRGIPLELIAECIEEARERRRRGRAAKPPRGLSYLAAAVEEAWSVVVDGRTRPAETGSATVAAATVAAWRWRIEQEKAASALGSLLKRLVSELDAGADPARIDAALDRGLQTAVVPELLRAAEREAVARLESYRLRLDRDQFDAATERAVTERLRRRLQLPHLHGAGS